MSYSQDDFFTNETIEELTKMDLTVDSNNGGLLLGPLHSEGGIPVLVRFADGYRKLAEFEGYEYLINPGASRQFTEELNMINDELKETIAPFIIPKYPKNITVIDCFSKSPFFKSKYLLTDARGGHIIINKFSTIRYIFELEEINAATKWKLIGEPFSYTDDFGI